MDDKCRVCGEEIYPLRNGLCETCIEKLYDEHESEIFLLLHTFPPNEWDETRCTMPLTDLWAEAERERFANDFGEIRKYIKSYVMEDKWCFVEWMVKVGII